ncbi:hypothetical protein SUGI_0376710 [Cryptomeria japonica]|nr:hypothetical protein SUGI_0376710 [Cryptomeria japonica]
MGNIGLCGSLINLPPCSSSKHKLLSRSKKVIIPVVIVVTILIMSFALIALSSRWRRAKNPPTSQNSPSLNVGNPRISYSELANSTGGFSEANLVGTGAFGSVYRGTLKNGTNIVVKVFNLLDANAHESFHRECNILKKIKHRNVIKIISVCSNLDFKALILPFMSNGSLERWLYPPTRSGCRLNLHDWLRIKMEIAESPQE